MPERSGLPDAGKLVLRDGRLPIPKSDIARARANAKARLSGDGGKLTSGHSWKTAEILIKRVIESLDATEDEADELLQEGRIIVWQADKAAAEGGPMGWGRFMLKRLHNRLPRILATLRSGGLTGAGLQTEVVSLDALREAPGGNEDGDGEDVEFDIADDRRPIEDQIDEEQQMERIRSSLPPSDYDLLARHHGLDGRTAQSTREIAAATGVPHRTVARKLAEILDYLKVLAQK